MSQKGGRFVLFDATPFVTKRFGARGGGTAFRCLCRWRHCCWLKGGRDFMSSKLLSRVAPRCSEREIIMVERTRGYPNARPHHLGGGESVRGTHLLHFPLVDDLDRNLAL